LLSVEPTSEAESAAASRAARAAFSRLSDRGVCLRAALILRPGTTSPLPSPSSAVLPPGAGHSSSTTSFPWILELPALFIALAAGGGGGGGGDGDVAAAVVVVVVQLLDDVVTKK
jgi:hypothetical protein